MKKNLKNRTIEMVISYWILDIGYFKAVSFNLLFLTLIVASCIDKSSSHEHDTYTCPMHPTVTSDKPGVCPVCGMDLVRKARTGEEVTITEDLANLITSPNKTVMASIKTLKGEFKSMPVSLEADGIVTYDTRNIYTIPARIGGRLENVFLKYAFQPVRNGQKVAEIYSPELVTAQRELLFLIETDPGNKEIIESSKNKLYLLGATQNQIEEIIKRKTAASTFFIYSPYDGYVVEEGQQTPAVVVPLSQSSSATAEDMEGSSTSSASAIAPAMNTASNELPRAGNYVTAGQSLFKVVNTSALRVELVLPAAQAGKVNLNDELDLDLGNQPTIKGKVNFVQPFFTEGQEFQKIRLYVKNTDGLSIGQFVRATVKLKPVEALWVPREAVLDLGVDKIVFLKDHDTFRPKRIQSGSRVDGQVAIVQGLASSDEIASNAQFLVDSESFIKTTK